MSLPKLTKSRLKWLKALYGWRFVARTPKPALRMLAQIRVDIDKIRYSEKWSAGRIALQRFRIGRTSKPRPKQRIPIGYRHVKISHWLKDHLRRIEAIAADTVCIAATGYRDSQSREDAITAFNDHITPIANLYGFKLLMVVAGGLPVLTGDIRKALSVLTYLCSSQRTPEIDWLLDVVTVWCQDRPLDWKRSWNQKLRHTKRGKFWRALADKQKQKDAIEAPKERKQQLERVALDGLRDGDVNRAFRGNDISVPLPDKRDLGTKADKLALLRDAYIPPGRKGDIPDYDDYD